MHTLSAAVANDRQVRGRRNSKRAQPEPLIHATAGDQETVEEKHLRLIRGELDAEREERMNIERNNADLHQQIAILQKRVLKEQEKTKLFPKVTSIVPTSLEANIHLRHQFQKSLENERAKYSALELENQRLVQEVRDIAMQNFGVHQDADTVEYVHLLTVKSKRALSIEETTQHMNEVAFWRNKVKELEGDKEVLKDKLGETERQLARETKEKERIFKEMVTMRRLQMHLSASLDGPAGANVRPGSGSQGNTAAPEPEFDDELTNGYLRSIGVSVKKDSDRDSIHSQVSDTDSIKEAAKRAKSATPARPSLKHTDDQPVDEHGKRMSVSGEVKHVQIGGPETDRLPTLEHGVPDVRSSISARSSIHTPPHPHPVESDTQHNQGAVVRRHKNAPKKPQHHENPVMQEQAV
eukprot:jgi/Hompol1/219/HPOL_002460-RA